MAERQGVTPNQLQNYMTRRSFEKVTDEIWEQLDESVTEKFFSNKGNLKPDKRKRFIRSLDLLLEEYPPHDLVKMDETCIKKDGSVDIEKFKQILSDSRSRNIPSNI
jgi:hypothetical protein